MTTNHLFEQETSAADLTVVGLGPGGLFAALEAASRGLKVVALTDRDVYVRGQWLVVDSNIRTLIQKHVDANDPSDQLFIKKIDDLGTGAIQTKDLENFLLRKLRHFENVQIISTKDNPMTSVGYGQKKLATFVRLQDGRQWYTRHILAADGASHGCANLINKQLQWGIYYFEKQSPERHEYHSVLQFKARLPYALMDMSIDPHSYSMEELKVLSQNRHAYIKHGGHYYYFSATDGSENLRELHLTAEQTVTLDSYFSTVAADTNRLVTNYKQNIVLHRLLQPNATLVTPLNQAPEAQLEQCQQLGWEMDNSPSVFYLTNSSKSKFYFAGEIPRALFEEYERNPTQTRQRLLQWAAIFLDLPVEQLEFHQSAKTPAKDRLQALVFRLSVASDRVAVRSLCHGGVFAQIGDARRTPDYRHAHGMNDALLGAHHFVQSIGDDLSFAKTDYVKAIKAMDARLPSLLLTKESKKAVQHLDRLIHHLEQQGITDIDQQTITTLKSLRTDVLQDEFAKALGLLRTVAGDIGAHQHRNHGFVVDLFRTILERLGFPSKTTTQILYDKTRTIMDRYSAP